MRGRIAEVGVVTASAAIITLVMAAPVLRAPSERLFGMEIVGRHYDPFVVIEQFRRPISLGVYSQPVTDIAGAWLARIFGAVAAYNALVLLSFSLAAAAAYLLARHLALSPLGASVAAIAYAFSPFHLAHAAYHPHIAQIQWLPLYLLALWQCIDDATPLAVAFLAGATLAVALSNFYGGFIAAAITPVAGAAYWLATRRTGVRSTRRLVITVACLAVLAGSGLAYVSYAAPSVFADRAAFAFARNDLFRYGAKWWSYLIPPVEHPLLGAMVRRFWTSVDVHEGLLEQQVTLGWGVIVLGLVAIARWMMSAMGRASAAPAHLPPFPHVPPVPALVTVAVAALVCSLSPERTIGSFTFVRPSAFLYSIAPMFRSYARFGVVVQLMAALLAGIGIDRLLRDGTRVGRMVCVALVVLAACEYVVSPWSLWRDVLPTAAHRWVVQQPDPAKALDCAPADQISESVPWLTNYRVSLLGGAITDCADQDLYLKLAANGFRYVIVRRDAAVWQRFDDRQALNGLRLTAQFDDGRVFEVTGVRP